MPIGYHHTAETKRKLSEAQLGHGQTLCVDCHKEKTKKDWKLIRASRQ